MMTPCAPAAKAVRTMAPRFRGSSTPSSKTSRPGAPCATRGFRRSSRLAAREAETKATTPWWSRVPAARSTCARSSKRTGTPFCRARRTSSSMRSPWRPRAISRESRGRAASSASWTAWIPVRRFIGCVNSWSVEHGAKFENAGAHGLDRREPFGSRRGIEEQDHAVEFPFPSAPGQRQAQRKKNPADPKGEFFFYRRDDFLQPVRIHRAAAQDFDGEGSNDFARAFAGQRRVAFRPRKHGASVILKNQREQSLERRSIRCVRAKQRR